MLSFSIHPLLIPTTHRQSSLGSQSFMTWIISGYSTGSIEMFLDEIMISRKTKTRICECKTYFHTEDYLFSKYFYVSQGDFLPVVQQISKIRFGWNKYKYIKNRNRP